MNVILSIKPQFVEEIIAGRKKYEFRKKGFKKQVRKVFLYASSPVCRFIGEFTLGQILEGPPDMIWSKTSSHAGITHESFDKYNDKKKIAYALEIKDLKVYDRPIDPLDLFTVFTPPQSFRYIRSEMLIARHPDAPL